MFIENLLPENIEKQRLSTQFVRLPVKGYPADAIKVVLADEGRTARFSQNTLPSRDLICTVPGPGELALYRKKAPHCIYGAMLVSTKTTTETSIVHFDKATRENFWNTATQFGRYCNENGLTPNVSFTYDPETHDRKSGQSQKWFHMHLNSRTPESMKTIRTERRPLSTESNVVKRRSLIEEFSILGSMMLYDKLTDNGGINTGKLKDVFEAEGLPNLAVILDGGWSILKSPKFDGVIATLHSATTSLTAELNSAFFEGSNNYWERPILNPAKIEEGVKRLTWLRDISKETLKYFLEHLRPELLQGNFLNRFKKHPNSPLTSFLYPLACPNYAVSITEKGQQVTLSMRPQMFSDTGAAGLYYVDRTVVKLGRGSETYTNTEMCEKTNFEVQFGKQVNNTN